jgi:ribosomal protein L7Ae-like RNA K-turn-binding protein
VHLSNGFTYRHIQPDAFAQLQKMGIPHVNVGSKTELVSLCGVDVTAGAPMKLDQASLDAVEAAAEAGAQQGSSGASAAEVREIVDEELDEQSLGGADKDG